MQSARKQANKSHKKKKVTINEEAAQVNNIITEENEYDAFHLGGADKLTLGDLFESLD